MKLPISWLNDFVDIKNITIDELKTKLFDIGFEVEEIIDVGREISNVVVGQIEKIEKHQNSDHLQICILNCGDFGKQIQIVTGAQNVFVGAKVPVALNGATLANGVKIKNGKLRGVDSNGMLCSGSELGIDENFFDGAGVDGILILPQSTEIGLDIKSVIGLNDFIFDLSITANRPDCQSILGIAREVASAFNLKLKEPETDYMLLLQQKPAKFSNNLTVNINANAKEKCLRYISTVLQNVKIEKSPIWLRQRLLLCDIIPKNNVVDLTNYILLELGQPMHAFDYSQIENKTIQVRVANHQEQIVTLDNKNQSLINSDLVICDGIKPIALAGIMGGVNSEILDSTQTVVFETATFAREGIRKTSRRLGLSSNSSLRYEKGVDVYTTGLASKRALFLAQKLQIGEITDFYYDSFECLENNQLLKQKQIEVPITKINQLLGIEIPQKDIIDILNRLNFKIEEQNDKLIATVPLYRNDISIYQDLAEEIIRMYGYSNIKSTLMEKCSITQGGLSNYQKLRNSVKNILVAQGMYEIKTFSFYSEKQLDNFKIDVNAKERKVIKILNPINEDLTIMRRLLAPSMVDIISKNLKRGVANSRLFELANIYIPKTIPIQEFPEERPILCLSAFGDNENFYTLKGCVEAVLERLNLQAEYQSFEQNSLPLFLHPYQSAKILVNEQEVGYIGTIAYDVLEKYDIEKPVYIAEIDYDLIIEKFNNNFQVVPVSKFHNIERDLSFVVPENLISGEIEKIIKQSAKYLSKVILFDVYKGEQVEKGKKSLTYHLTFTPKFEEELTHEEVDKQIQKILKNLKEKLQITIRE